MAITGRNPDQCMVSAAMRERNTLRCEDQSGHTHMQTHTQTHTHTHTHTHTRVTHTHTHTPPICGRVGNRSLVFAGHFVDYVSQLIYTRIHTHTHTHIQQERQVSGRERVAATAQCVVHFALVCRDEREREEDARVDGKHTEQPRLGNAHRLVDRTAVKVGPHSLAQAVRTHARTHAHALTHARTRTHGRTHARTHERRASHPLLKF
jgi:hypothetical protein